MRIVVVSNRLPVIIEAGESGFKLRPGSGGLVTALSPVLRRRGGVWIGWPGAASDDEATLREILATHSREVGYELQPVLMSPAEVEGFYDGFCNEIIWPLFHDLQSECNFEPSYWTQYVAVKEKFAEVVQRHVTSADLVWVHDYHLLGLGRQLRTRGLTNRLGFFLHIPFPPPDIFCKLPWRTDVLQSLTHYDVIGFQTPRDRENFLDCVRRLLPEARLRPQLGMVECRLAGRSAQIGAFPIGIDYEQFAQAAASPPVTQRVQELREQIPSQQIVLGLDRLDYTKGIPYRLRAFHLALKRYPELHRNVTLLQVVVPSREAVPQYQELKAQIERLVTQINGEFTQPGWVPIHHVFRSLEHEELLAYYRVADVALVTPLKDGMNLVAKEYCACQVDGDGVLILSEFAGAAVQLHRDAILVNPYDLDRVADAIRVAVSLARAQRRPPMRRLRSIVRRQDVYWWVDCVLRACERCAMGGRTDNPRANAAHGLQVYGPDVHGRAGIEHGAGGGKAAHG
jgi:alpha,alpha-trehalose-phosphate synthase [UDP-forming]